MALARADLNTAVTAELAGVLSLAGFTSADTTTNMKEVLDRTFRALGVAEADLVAAAVATGEEEKSIAFATYFTISKAVMSTVNKMAVAAGSAKAELIQQHENLLRMLANALLIAQHFGLDLPGNGVSGFIPIPYAGGMSQSDYAAVAASDRLPPLFSLEDITVPGVGGVLTELTP